MFRKSQISKGICSDADIKCMRHWYWIWSRCLQGNRPEILFFFLFIVHKLQCIPFKFFQLMEESPDYSFIKKSPLEDYRSLIWLSFHSISLTIQSPAALYRRATLNYHKHPWTDARRSPLPLSVSPSLSVVNEPVIFQEELSAVPSSIGRAD